MDEHEFRSALELFPIVRPRDFHFDSGASSQSSSHKTRNVEATAFQDSDWGNSDIKIQGYQDAFWNKLKAAAEKKVGTTDAERFCKAFKQVYEKLVYEELSQDAAQSLMNLTIS
ncbi:hypothetical protein LIER_01228 [Lithospermum erythrorhizon]|uniref:Uncharacterized protein n=1 Tax=Lithospermum erythrorhizon TaxID=34254 RepID=A0AAV3NKX2_LITER